MLHSSPGLQSTAALQELSQLHSLLEQCPGISCSMCVGLQSSARYDACSRVYGIIQHKSRLWTPFIDMLWDNCRHWRLRSRSMRPS